LLGSGFQRRTFLFLMVPELSLASVGRSVKLLLAFASTVILGFALLEIHD
jgi:hypothetical protein